MTTTGVFHHLHLQEENQIEEIETGIETIDLLHQVELEMEWIETREMIIRGSEMIREMIECKKLC